MKSLYQVHAEKWKDCRRCELAAGRQRVVLARGAVPCDVLFVGEAPGQSEDVLGRPFVGPAGHLLDYVVGRGLPHTFRAAFTNLVACIPLGDDGEKVAEPADDSIRACAPRLQELVKIASPRLIVCVGKLAETWLTPGMRDSIDVGAVPRVAIQHPAFILRANDAARGLLIQKAVVTLRNAVEDHLQ